MQAGVIVDDLVRLAEAYSQSEEDAEALYRVVRRLLDDGFDALLDQAIAQSNNAAAESLSFVISDLAHSAPDLLSTDTASSLSMQLFGLAVLVAVPAEEMRRDPNLLSRVQLASSSKLLHATLGLPSDDVLLLQDRLYAPEELAFVPPSQFRQFLKQTADELSQPTGLFPTLPYQTCATALQTTEDFVLCARLLVGCAIGDESEQLLIQRLSADFVDGQPGEAATQLARTLESRIRRMLPKSSNAQITVFPAVAMLEDAIAEASAFRAATATELVLQSFLSTLDDADDADQTLYATLHLQLCVGGLVLHVQIFRQESEVPLFKTQVRVLLGLDDASVVVSAIKGVLESSGFTFIDESSAVLQLGSQSEADSEAGLGFTKLVSVSYH